MIAKPTSMAPSTLAIDPPGLMGSRPTFSHVASSLGDNVRFISTAGQVGVDSNGDFPTDRGEQIQMAFSNLRRCLEAAGATVQDIQRLVYYIVDYDHTRRDHFQPLKTFLNGHRPATTLIPVPKLFKPGVIFEVEAYLAVPQNQPCAVDVVVIGAGLSGLTAASQVQSAGFSCAVLEARDRVGGKTWSIDGQGTGKTVDAGAAWINDTNQSEVFELAKSLNLELVVQNTTGKIVQQDLDGKVSTFDYGDVPELCAETNGSQKMVKIRDLAEEVCQKLDIRNPSNAGADLDLMTLEDWVIKHDGGKSGLAAATIWTRAMLGMEPQEMSALFFLNYCCSGGGLMQMRSDRRNGGQYLRFVEGTQSLSTRLAATLEPNSLVLRSPVRFIQQSPTGTVVCSARGKYICKRVILSIPTPLYKDIIFDPPLPEEKQKLSQQNKLGFINKICVRYASPWWRQGGLTGMIQSFTGPISVTRDISVDKVGHYALTCFCAGSAGRALSSLSQAERFKIVTGQIKATLGTAAGVDVPEPIGIDEHEWARDIWSQGCPSPASPPGVMSQYERALRAIHGKIHFVGTETAYEWKGYLEGAIRAGKRGAKEVVHALGASKM